MREDVLQYIWQHRLINQKALQTTSGERLTIVNPGILNTNSGPDFFNAQLQIEEQRWAGTVEVHLKSSDWYAHQHQTDLKYNNVILHVVWEHDLEVFRADKTRIPVLELQHIISSSWMTRYEKLYKKPRKFINCENRFNELDSFKWNNWVERLYIERLETKYKLVEGLLAQSQNNWEAVLFKMLCRAFGLKVNAEAFFDISKSFSFKRIQELKTSAIDIEALLFGQAKLLDSESDVFYEQDLYKRHKFFQHKYNLQPISVDVEFFRLRPLNFPTIRLSQLAQLYAKHSRLFTALTNKELTLNTIYELLYVTTSSFWETHYTFGKASLKRVKSLSKAFINGLILNAIAPVQFSYAKHNNQFSVNSILEMVASLPPEKNSIISKFNNLKPVGNSALATQSLLQLKQNYCIENKCVQCAVGQLYLK